MVYSVKKGGDHMDLGLEEKIVVITGGSAGIGYAAAKFFAAEGARVIICGRRLEVLEQAAASLGSKVLPFRADVTCAADVASLGDYVWQRFGVLDVWVNNVGATIARAGQWYTEAEIDATYAVNFKSVVMGSQIAASYMIRRGGGVIINVASLAARCASSGRASLYGPLKSAVVNYTNTFAGEVAAQGIRVVAVMPGFTTTPLAKTTIAPAEFSEQSRLCLLHRAAAPEEIAAPIVFLASDRAAYITSTAVEISGGRSTVLNPNYSYE